LVYVFILVTVAGAVSCKTRKGSASFSKLPRLKQFVEAGLNPAL
jgi:hypothetical protein